MNVYLDLETLPDLTQGAKERVKATLKAPANYKKPDVIAQWIDENAEEAWRKTSFDGGYGSICVIGYAINDNPVEMIIVEDEKQALQDFAARVDYANLNHEGIEFIGHNLLGFDLPFLWKRSVIHNTGHRHIPKDARHGAGRAFCTMQQWTGFTGKISLDALAGVLGLQSHKADFDGSMVYDAWMAGEKQRVADYCKQDVELTRQIYKRIA